MLSENGIFLPPCTTVGRESLRYQPEYNIHGADTHAFRLRCWLKLEGELMRSYEDRLARMKATDMTDMIFGAGKRF